MELQNFHLLLILSIFNSQHFQFPLKSANVGDQPASFAKEKSETFLARVGK